MQHPYQALAVVRPVEHGQPEHVLAACGPKLLFVNVEDGKVVSEWSSATTESNATNDKDNKDSDERPKKKQKKAAAASTAASPNIIKLKVSTDQRHAVVVTDDKALRVFRLEECKLTELSQRTMPKRPCAIDILHDNSAILCADKFGDVYSLPLLPQPTETEAAAPVDAEPEKPAWKPSASTATVHSKRNRETLAAQIAQKNFTAKKEALKFEHKLLLGHVSMLTDMCFASRTVEGKQRGYIITADRDEHIRVSRGPPQAHIIEGYCLAHHEYVSKICLIPGTDLMVSGGGDGFLCVWQWPGFRLVRKIEFSDYVLGLCASGAKKDGVASKQDGEAKIDAADTSVKATKETNKAVNVSGLWTVPVTSEKGDTELAVVVALERIPVLLIIQQSFLTTKVESAFGMAIHELDHAPLDVTAIGSSMLVSLDAREDGKERAQAFKLSQDEEGLNSWRVQVERDEALEEKLKCLTSIESAVGKVDDKALDELLYGVANLRKRRGWDNAEGAAEDMEAVSLAGDAVVSDQVPDETPED